MTTGRLSVPPGRAGRLSLTARLETARRGAGLLDRKLRLLRDELARRQSAAELAAERWDRCQADAQRWLLRAGLLGGQHAIRLAADGQFADVTVTDTLTIGIRYPATATCTIPAPATWDGPALAQARRAHRDALAAAVQHAVAARALHVIESEALATRHRLRAIQDRWIPQLEQALAQVSLAVEELERADAARLRLAMGRAVTPPEPREEDI